MNNYITGNKALAAILGRTVRTIHTWKSEGVLDAAIVSNFRRTIIYDLDKVYQCLNNKIVSAGRPKIRHYEND